MEGLKITLREYKDLSSYEKVNFNGILAIKCYNCKREYNDKRRNNALNYDISICPYCNNINQLFNFKRYYLIERIINNSKEGINFLARNDIPNDVEADINININLKSKEDAIEFINKYNNLIDESKESSIRLAFTKARH